MQISAKVKTDSTLSSEQAKPVILINFKKVSAAPAVKILSSLNKIPDSLCKNYDILMGIQSKDIPLFSENGKFQIVIQDIFCTKENDLDHYFRHTSINDRGVYGILLNHPEKQIKTEILESYLLKAREMKLKIFLCSTNITEAVALHKYNPDFLAIESEGLIGKPDSFINHCPDIVKEVKSKIDSNILIGAGIKSAADFRYVLKDGGIGVLISSLILNSTNPKTTLENFLGII